MLCYVMYMLQNDITAEQMNKNSKAELKKHNLFVLCIVTIIEKNSKFITLEYSFSRYSI